MHEDIERLIKEELAKINGYTGRLEELRDAPAFVRFSDAEAAGTLAANARDRWAVVRRAVMTAASRLGKWRETVAEASRLLQASPPDPGRARELLRGRSVALTPEETPKEDRRPPSLSYSDPRFSLRTIGDYIAADIQAARAVLEELRADPGAVSPDGRGGPADRAGLDGPAGPDAERELLRARLELYRRRARRLGHGRPELDAQYRRARALLDATPCDLGRCAEAVREYMVLERGEVPEAGSHER